MGDRRSDIAGMAFAIVFIVVIVVSGCVLIFGQ